MIELLRRRLADYAVTDARQEEQALKEILQEVALYALWRADFFEVAAFQGGTSLRLLHGLRRFSEDLDFILKTPSADFAWSSYFDGLVAVLAEFGVRCELSDRHRMDRAVLRAMLKDDSIARQLNLSFYRHETGRQLKIKLEIDTNPPADSGFDYHYLDFPLDFELCTQDLASNFALKLHALLCRPYLKGRDWFDFGWYVAQGVTPNLPHLAAALDQHGPWQGQGIKLDRAWLESALIERILAIAWPTAAQDVAPFLAAPEQAGLKLWSERFFAGKVAKLVSMLPPV
jgi:predicted nucleotidyltransferase component of viral defense system